MRHIFIIALFFVSLSVMGQALAIPHAHRRQQQQQTPPQQQPQQQQQNDQFQRRNNRGGGAGNGNNNANRKAPNRFKRIKEIKTAYITQKLNLTADQSSKFWPLYTQYQEEMFAVQTEIRQNNSPLQTNGKDQVMNELSLDEKKNNIKRRYANEFMKILPPEKVSLIYKSEKEFQDEIIKAMRDKKNEADN
jgi:hypothetical protein